MAELVSIEPMQDSDLPAILAIEKQSFRTPWTKYAFTKFLKEHTSLCIVARNQEDVIGYGVGWFTRNECHIGNVAVAEDHRRKGIASLLLKSMLKTAWEKGVGMATLEVRISNSPAISLYKRHGFKETAIRKGYYYPDGEDALVMMKEIRLENLKQAPHQTE